MFSVLFLAYFIILFHLCTLLYSFLQVMLKLVLVDASEDDYCTELVLPIVVFRIKKWSLVLPVCI
jgi:hypothetical protein